MVKQECGHNGAVEGPLLCDMMYVENGNSLCQTVMATISIFFPMPYGHAMHV